MRSKAFLFFAIIFSLAVICTSLLPHTASAESPSLKRVQTVGFKYVAKYKGRLINAEVAFKQLQKFLDTVQWKPNRHYSFNRDVLHNNLLESDGYVDTPLGYAFGACGAPSLLNKMIQTTTFRDSDGKEKPLFETIVLWWWRGDPTYETYGATIFIDPTGAKAQDFVWKMNPAYNGTPPTFKITFDAKAETVDMVMEYSDEPPPTAKPTLTSTAAPTKPDATKAQPTATATLVPTKVATQSPTSVPTRKPSLTPTTVPTAFPTKVAIKPTVDPLSDIPKTVMLPLTPRQRSELLLRYYKGLIRGNRFTVSIVPIGDANELIEEVGVNEKVQTYVASAFKGAVAVYFFENIKADVWKSVPVKYWNAQTEDEVPKEFRAAWKRHKDILGDVWTSTVWSENDSTGDVLDYVYKNSSVSKQASNPILAFNNWAHSTGVSKESGLRSWYSGKTLCQECLDERYGKFSFIYSGKVLIPNNSYSARDLAQIYVHLATKGRELGYYPIANELLSSQRAANAPSMIQHFLRKRGIATASKDGFVGPDDQDSDGYYVSTDAGLITLPDGKQFAVAFMAFDSGNLLDDAISTLALFLVPEVPKKP